MIDQTVRSIDAIIRPLRTANYEVDYPWSGCERMLAWLAEGTGGPVDLIPDFQRGHVWTDAQQQHFVENVLRGVVDASGLALRFNAPAWEKEPSGDLPATVVCVDGLQRLTAVRRFVAGEVKPFGLHVSELDGTPYRVSGPSNRYRFRVMVYTFQWRADLLAHYLDINRGGTPHSAAELTRVEHLLHAAHREG